MNSTMQIILIIIITMVSALKMPLSINNQNNLKHLRTIFMSIINETNIFNIEIVTLRFHYGRSLFVEELIQTALEELPVNCIASSNDHARNLWPKVDASTHTLLVYIYRSHNLSAFMDLKDTSYILLHNGARPKILLVTILKQLAPDFQSLFEFMWSNKILNVNILDISYRNDSINFMIHQYNPFSKNYTIRPFSKDIKWFPDKLLNMHGYPVMVDVLFHVGHNSLYRNSQGYPVKFGGPDARALNSWQTAMNFSVIFLPMKHDLVSYRVINKTIPHSLGRLQRDEVDVSMTSLVAILEMRKELAQTPSHTTQKWCVLMPVLYKENNIMYHGIFGISLSFAIVTLFWATSILLKFHSNSWQPLNIFGMIITISLSKFRMTTVPERIVFVSIVIVGSLYSSGLYTQLTIANIQSKIELPIETFTDLARTGLIPVFYEEMFHMIFDNADDDLLALKPLIRLVDFRFDCGHYLMKYMNVCCLMEMNNALVFVYESKLQSNVEITMNEKLCFWNPPSGYYLNKYSPYVEKFGHFTVRAREAGIRQRWFIDYFSDLTPRFQKANYSKNGIHSDATIDYRILTIIGYGYFISFLVFLGEILVHRFKQD